MFKKKFIRFILTCSKLRVLVEVDKYSLFSLLLVGLSVNKITQKL